MGAVRVGKWMRQVLWVLHWWETFEPDHHTRPPHCSVPGHLFAPQRPGIGGTSYRDTAYMEKALDRLVAGGLVEPTLYRRLTDAGRAVISGDATPNWFVADSHNVL